MDPIVGGFVGREAELARIDAAVASVANGRSALVWIEGEAGAGKSSLLEVAVQRLPAGFVVMRAEADEFATDSPYSLVRQLAPVRADTTMGAALQLLGGLADLGERRPGTTPVLAVEDLHWADPASREALLIMARRLPVDRVLMLVTTRPPTGPQDGWERLRLDARRCEFILLGALSIDEVTALAARSGVELSRSAAQRLHAHTGGHALYVRTLLSELRPEQLTAADGVLPAPRSLAATAAARLASSKPDAVALALALAVLGRPSDLALVGRVAGVENPTAALEALRHTGFVVSRASDPGNEGAAGGFVVIGFAHPLFRSAVLDDLSPMRRQALHAAAGQELGPRAGLAHRVAATDRFDDDLADLLVVAAEDEKSFGARAIAAQNLLWAARVRSSAAIADGHVLAAARLLFDDGEHLRARGLRDRVASAVPSPTRSLVLGMLEWEAGDSAAAAAHLSDAVASTDPAFRSEVIEAEARLARVHAITGEGSAAIRAAEHVLAQPDLAPALARMAWTAGATGVLMRDGGCAALRWLTPRLPQLPGDVDPSDVDVLIVRGTLAYYARRNAAAATDLRAAIELIRGGAHVDDLPRAHLQLAQVLALTGEWDEALVHARLALSLVSDRELVWMRAQSNAVLATLMGVRGHWPEAETHLARAADAARRTRTSEAAFTARIAAANVARARGDAKAVLSAYQPLLADGTAAARSRIPMATALTWFGQIVSATIETGESALAEERLQLFDDAAAERDLELAAPLLGLQAQLLAARPDATASDADAAIRLYGDALAAVTGDDSLLDRALLHHRLGRLLLARGERRAGAAELRAALRILDAAGAAPYVARVTADLEQTGGRVTLAPERPVAALTEREQDVVALVAKGLTNREVAAQLYVTDKAVEYHLGNVYAKLGIRSRRELRSWV